jgi:putative PIN family toxin of toxin-antitoxin system
MRWVLDTNVVASAMLWGGVPRVLMQAARERRIEIYSSVPMLAELADILSRRKFEKKLLSAGVTIDLLVQSYAQLAQIVHPAAVPRTAPDPDDDVVIATALAAQASGIVTGDKALLTVSGQHGVNIFSVAAALAALSA